MPFLRNTRQSVNRISGRFLAPGLNEVSDRELEILNGNRHFKAQLSLGYIELVKNPGNEEKPAKHLNLGTAQAPNARVEEELSAKDKIALVEKTTDVDQLNVWLKTDARKTVQAAIEDRIAKLAQAGKE